MTFPRHSSKVEYLFLILGSTFLQGSSFVSTKVVMVDIPPIWTAAARFLIAALSLAPVAFIQMQREKIKLSKLPWLKLFSIGALQTAGVMAFLNLGLQSVSPPTAAIIMASNPLLVVILAWLFLGERSSMAAIIGLGMAFIGVVICVGIASSTSSGLMTGDILVMLASACWACSTILNKHYNMQLSPWVMTFFQMLLGSIILLLVASFSGTRMALPATPWRWFMFIWLAIPASTGAMGLWFAALRLGGSVQTSGFLFLCPVFAALIAFMLYAQVPSLHEITGAVLIATGLVVMSKSR